MEGHRVAVVGMACRYPDAATPGELWQTVLARRRAFRRIPDTRLNPGYRGSGPDQTYATHAAVLRDWTFDRERFGVPGPLYRAADTTHWLALETAAAALDDAGFAAGDGLDRDLAGVILGNSLTGEFSRAAMLRLRWPFLADAATAALDGAGVPTDLACDVLRRLEDLVKEPFAAPGDETLSGSLANTIAGRICNHFDFHGTGYTVDGACSSSLLAVAAACRALVSQECDFVLAGGVDLSLDPLELVGFSRLGALARQEMRVYDARPTGFLPGEGCGMLALMRAEDAEARGLRSYAHIVGWASSSDGSGGLTRPEASGQLHALHRAYRMAGFAPEHARLVEGHGTGTAIGDRAELAALIAARGHGAEPAALGSVKANIGHTKAAAGAAGLIKAALAAYHRVLPPATGCEQPHELLAERDVPLRVLDTAEPWTDDLPRAGVSSMGFGGINVHVVLEGTRAAAPGVLPAGSSRRGPHEIVLISDTDTGRLAERLDRFAGTARTLSTAELTDIAATAWQEHSIAPYRAALVAKSPDELADAARAASAAVTGWAGEIRCDERAGYALASATGSRPRIGLLFPGQAAPVRPRLAWWAQELGIPPLDDATSEGSATDTETAQPAIVKQSLAALAWLDALGCTAIGACGHSLGEITALCWAGHLAIPAALELAVQRGRVMGRHGIGGTTMAGIAAAPPQTEELLTGTACVVACHNAPLRAVVAGPEADVSAVLARAAATGVTASRLPVSHGFHSPAMSPAADPLREVLAAVPLVSGDPGSNPGRHSRTVHSTITGGRLAASPDRLRDLLVEQLTAPVRFADAVTTLAADCDLLIEAGPGTILTELAAANGITAPAVSMDAGGDPRGHAFVTALLAVCAGADLEPWFADRTFRPLDLDATPQFLANPCESRTHDAESHVHDAESHTHDAESHVPAPRAPTESHLPPRTDPLAALTGHLADTLELPPSAIAPASSLLGDLHMTSLQVVDAVATVAASLGKDLPSMPLSLSDATVAEAADVLGSLPAADSLPTAQTAAGVRSWVRAFEHVWTPFTPSTADGSEIRWSVHAPAGHWLHEHATGLDGLAVALADQASTADVATVLERIATLRPSHLVIVHTGHPAGAGIARSAVAELPGCQASVIQVPEASHRVPIDEFAGPRNPRYLEVRVTPAGYERVVTRVRPKAAAGDLNLTGTCLVTGGVRGITSSVAAALAEHTGCTPLFVGRTPEDDPEIVAATDALGRAAYLQCDVTDPRSVAAMLARSRAEHGPIRALLHGAGINEPRKLADVTPDSLQRTVAPKVDGLRVLLDALGDDLRLVLGFGSIIGRQGLAGQGEYCIANDWMRADLEAWAAKHPACRTHLLEWSVWSGVGMGVRLGVLDNLRRQGVEPIGPEQGISALRELLADPDAPVTTLVSARFPSTPTLQVDGPPAPLLRFAEHVRTRVPGIEAVVESTLSPGSDPYLDDHRIDGTPVLPAVVAMEAMTQAAVLAGAAEPGSLTDLQFRAPILVSGPEPRTIQVAALAEGNGRVQVALRDDSDTYVRDRCTGVLAPAPRPPTSRGPARPLCASPESDDFYGGVFFHSGRFRRVAGYDMLSAFRAVAWVRAADDGRWFSDFHSQRLLLGDPGGHDACLHALLACVPHRRALPVGVDRMTVWRRQAGMLRVDATEVSHTPDEYVFDIDVTEPGGAFVARWEGLRLRAVTAPAAARDLPEPLVGPWLSRRMVECGFADHIELVTQPARRSTGDLAALAERITSVAASHDPVGRLRVDGYQSSASYAADQVLLALAAMPVGVDWESIPPNPQEAGNIPCCAPDRGVADLLADKLGESAVESRLRVWTAREAIVKVGFDQEQPLRIDYVTEDGLAVIRSGAVQALTAKVRSHRGADKRLHIAAVAQRSDAR